MAGGVSAKALNTDLKTGLAFLTRLPLVHSQSTTGADLVRASWTFPIVGAGVGAFGALIYWLTHALGLHAFVGAVLAVAGTLSSPAACTRTALPTRRTASAPAGLASASSRSCATARSALTAPRR